VQVISFFIELAKQIPILYSFQATILNQFFLAHCSFNLVDLGGFGWIIDVKFATHRLKIKFSQYLNCSQLLVLRPFWTFQAFFKGMSIFLDFK